MGQKEIGKTQKYISQRRASLKDDSKYKKLKKKLDEYLQPKTTQPTKKPSMSQKNETAKTSPTYVTHRPKQKIVSSSSSSSSSEDQWNSSSTFSLWNLFFAVCAVMLSVFIRLHIFLP